MTEYLIRFKVISITVLMLLACTNICNSTDSVSEAKIVFVSDRETNNIYQLFIMNADGTDPTRLTNDTNNYRYPSFSPDGSKILFYSHTWTDTDEIYSIDINGDNLANLSNSPGSDNHPVYSPNGKKIVFTSTRDGNREIYIMNADGSGQTRLTNNQITDHSPQFIYNGTKILYYTFDSSDRSYNIIVMDADGGHPRILTNEAEYFYTEGFVSEDAFNIYDGQPSVSINENDIVFSAYDQTDKNYRLYRENIDGSDLGEFYYPIGFYDLYPRFTPCGERIVFRSHRGVNYDLYMINKDGTDIKNLTNDSGHAYFSQFVNGGSKILYNTDRHIYYKIWIMDSDGSNQTQLTFGEYSDLYPNYKE